MGLGKIRRRFESLSDTLWHELVRRQVGVPIEGVSDNRP